MLKEEKQEKRQHLLVKLNYSVDIYPNFIRTKIPPPQQQNHSKDCK